MTTVFVHGNPETDAIWSDLVGELAERQPTGESARDLVLLSPPGFGAPLPDGWGATRKEYLNWLVAEVEALAAEGPVDIVGHDWGAGHVFGLLSVRSDLVRSWVCDCLGLIHPDYVWHDMAQLWQTPEVGEEVVNGMRTASRDERITMMTVSGMNEHAAADVADALDTMADCILPLYRSGAQPAVSDLGRELAGAHLPPGLALDPSEDPYVGPAGRAAEMADQLGARHAPLDGAGHWWMCEQPAAAADLFVEFWGSLDA